MTPLITIATPTWNNLEQLEWCIDSLFKYASYSFSVVVVDNGGKGEVEKLLSAKDYSVKVLNSDKNLGWMRAINLVLKDCDTEYFCMMNDDVVFTPSSQMFWPTLIEHFKDETVGAVGPCSNYVAGPQSLMAQDTSIIFNATTLIGFCSLVRTGLIQQLGGLDESLPGGDDFDLSIRIREAGYHLRVDKTAYLHHFGQQTGSRLYKSFWDSSWHQELVNNALIKKHGINSWLKSFYMGWYEPILKEA